MFNPCDTSNKIEGTHPEPQLKNASKKMRNLAGQMFGRLTVIKYIKSNVRGRAEWLCRCACGNEKVILGDHLTRKKNGVLSCGCFRQECHIKHGAYLSTADIKYHVKFTLLQGLKDRARRRGYESDLELSDMPEIPEVCPVLGTPLLLHRKWDAGKGRGKGRNRLDSSPTIDRLNPNLPYLKKYCSNLFVISWRANKLKSDGSLLEFEKLVEYMRKGASNRRESHLIDSKSIKITADNEAEVERHRERLSDETLEINSSDAIV